MGIKFYIGKLAEEYPLLGNLADRMLHPNREIGIFTDIPTMLWRDEREFLYSLATRNSNAVEHIVEIGCYAGGSTYFLARGAKLTGATVYSIDPFKSSKLTQMVRGDCSGYLNEMHKKPSKDEVLENLRRNGVSDSVVLVEGFSEDVARSWNGEKIGFLWIDGNHTRAREDFYDWRKYLARDAVVAFHDSNYPTHGRQEVTRDVEQLIEREDLSFLDRVDSITVLQT